MGSIKCGQHQANAMNIPDVMPQPLSRLAEKPGQQPRPPCGMKLERDAWIMEGLREIQISKGKLYSEVIEQRFGMHDVSRALRNLVADIASTGIARDEWELAIPMLRKSEFTHTAFSPLPDTAQIVKLLNAIVNDRPAVAKPEPQGTTTNPIELPGAVITSEGEYIKRDEHFFHNAALMGIWPAMPAAWVAEASRLSGGLMGNKLIWYFETLTLNARTPIPLEAIERQMVSYLSAKRPWKRYR